MRSDESISKYRDEIDVLDKDLLRLLNRRAAICERIGVLKRIQGLPLRDKQRELYMFARLAGCSDGPLEESAVTSIFRQIVEESCKIQEAVARKQVSAVKTRIKSSR